MPCHSSAHQYQSFQGKEYLCYSTCTNQPTFSVRKLPSSSEIIPNWLWIFHYYIKGQQSCVINHHLLQFPLHLTCAKLAWLPANRNTYSWALCIFLYVKIGLWYAFFLTSYPHVEHLKNHCYMLPQLMDNFTDTFN